MLVIAFDDCKGKTRVEVFKCKLSKSLSLWVKTRATTGMEATNYNQYYPARLSIMSHKVVLISNESVH